jgi:hypothetical protein
MGEFLLELLMELIGEVVLAIFGEALEATVPGRESNPVLAAFGFALLGALGGWISSLIWQRPVIHDVALRWLVFVVSPVACALAMFLLALRRVRRGRPRAAVHAAWHGLFLALAYQTVRLVGTR